MLAPIVLVGMLAVVIVGPAATGEQVTYAVGWGLLLVALLIPLAIVPNRGVPGAWRASMVAAAFLLLSAVSLRLPRLGLLAELQWNWQGKLLDLVWVLILYWVLRDWAVREAGLRWRAESGSLRPALVFISAAFIVPFGLTFAGLALSDEPVTGFGLERMLFDLTFPNLSEEMIWRGAMMAVLDRALGTPWGFFGARVGWGLVLTSVGFGLGHGVVLDADSGLSISLASALITGVAGLGFGWVRARTGTLWAAYLAHCAPEVAIGVAVAVGGR